METRTRRNAQHWMMAGTLALAPPLAAVELSPSGEGDALIFPIWATTNGHLSVLSVVDSQRWRYPSSQRPTQAVKLLLRNAQGQLLFHANLYLHNGEDSWTASLVSLPDGRSRLDSSDDSCVLVGAAGEAAPWSGSAELNADHGFIELIVMGTFPISTAAVDCAGLAERWNSGTWSQDPADGLDESISGAALRGTLNLVNVPKGTAYTIPATVLREFSDVSQHTAPSSTSPDLASVHDSGTAEGATRSRVCDVGSCKEDTWASPRDAVAAALMASNVRGEFSGSPSLAGQSDLVFTYPLRHYFGEDDHPRLGGAQPMLVTFNRRGESVGGTIVVCPSVPEGCPPVWPLEHPDSVGVFSFPAASGSHPPRPSSVLGIEVGSMSNEMQAPAEGTFRASWFANLVSNGGTNYTGFPVIGVVLQQFENGNLTSEDGVQQRANYGVAVPMTRIVP